GLERDLIAPTDAVDDAEVGGREDPEVLAVLVVDAPDALGDHDADPRVQDGVRARLPAASLAPPLPRHGADEPAVLHGPPLHGVVGRARAAVRGPQAEIREVAERLVVEEADVGGRDLVRGDLVTEPRAYLVVELEVASLVVLRLQLLGVVDEVE